MNGNQRPERVRLFSSAQPKPAARRRRGDWPHASEEEEAAMAMAPVAAPVVVEVRKPRTSMLPMVLLFMLGSALGGMFVGALGLFRESGL